MQILIIEDEISVSQYLSDGLKKEGYGIQSAASIEEIDGLLAIKDAVEPDVIIMDRLLNGLDTATKLSAIKQKWPRSAVLVLSAIGGPSDKSRLLDTGADDYMSKPFSIEELSSRIRVLIRRQKSSAETGLALGNTRVNLQNQTLEISGKRVDLSRKEFQVFVTLLQNPTRVYNRYQLLDHVWDVHSDIESNVVEVTIKNLRRKLEDNGASVVIQSKRNVGYWLEG